MKTTGNLGLKKPEGTDIVDINDLNGNMDILDTAVKAAQDHAADTTKHSTAAERTAWNAKASTSVATTAAAGLMAAADKVLLNNNTGYGTTAGTATAYTVTLSPAPTLAAGMKFSFKAHAASGANPTLNPNGLGAKPVKKPNGNAATLALNGVYTVVYDGTNFILQGEGGEYGTALAEDVLSGRTIGTDRGLVSGTRDRILGDSNRDRGYLGSNPRVFGGYTTEHGHIAGNSATGEIIFFGKSENSWDQVVKNNFPVETDTYRAPQYVVGRGSILIAYNDWGQGSGDLEYPAYYLGTNNGDSWRVIARNQLPSIYNVHFIGKIIRAGNRFIAVVEANGETYLRYSEDGINWTRSTLFGASYFSTCQPCLDPYTGLVWAFADNNQLCFSEDFGQTFAVDNTSPVFNQQSGWPADYLCVAGENFIASDGNYDTYIYRSGSSYWNLVSDNTSGPFFYAAGYFFTGGSGEFNRIEVTGLHGNSPKVTSINGFPSTLYGVKEGRVLFGYDGYNSVVSMTIPD